MKFLIDAQLPKSLSEFLKHKGFNSIHTLELPGKNRTKDIQIIQEAIKENRVVISKDNDFLDSFLIKSEPPKLIKNSTFKTPTRLRFYKMEIMMYQMNRGIEFAL